MSAFATAKYSGAAVPEGGGGGFAAISGGHLEITDAAIESCSCGNAGAAVLIGAGSTGIMKQSTVDNVHAGTRARSQHAAVR